MEQKHYDNWHYKIDEHKIMWLYIDRKDASVNSLNVAVFDEFDQLLSDIAGEQFTGLILSSTKKSGFVAGADISQFTHLKDEDEAFKIIRQAQLVLDKLEALSYPTVAIINGFCLGGGLELALACRYRIAEDQPKTQIGLPEVKLGIHPGWGGTVRLPRLIGAKDAIPLILSGKTLSARAALKLGIVDAAVPLRDLERAAKQFILNQPAPHQPSGIDGMSNWSWTRRIWANIFERKLREKVNPDHYPAPFAVIKNWEKDGISNKAYLTEAHSIAALLVTETSRNLVRDFFLQTKMRGLAKEIKYKPQHVHVIGAGTMGGDIAAWCAYKGFTVTLQDRAPENIAPAMKRAGELFKKKLKEERLIRAAWDRLQPDVSGKGIAEADVIIEAVFEDLKVKQAIFKEVEAVAKTDAILATNTSSIPLAEIGSVLKNPSRLIGLHFFNPVAKMMLVEVVKGEDTDQDNVLKGQAVAGAIGKLPLPVHSSPGFLINRVLMPYLLEAVYMMEEDIGVRAIDQAAVNFGMPMGPVELADRVGLDICLAVARNLSEHYGFKVPDALENLVKAGHLGAKTGRGFYLYQKGKATTNNEGHTKLAESVICDRLILSMLNQAVACLREEVVADQDLLDGGMVFGTGFAPFRGGPIQYAKTRGVKSIIALLNQFANEYGERFKPDEGWALIK